MKKVVSIAGWYGYSAYYACRRAHAQYSGGGGMMKKMNPPGDKIPR